MKRSVTIEEYNKAIETIRLFNEQIDSLVRNRKIPLHSRTYLKECDVSNRLLTAMMGRGIETVGDLYAYHLNWDALKKTKKLNNYRWASLGPKTIDEIRAFFNLHPVIFDELPKV